MSEQEEKGLAATAAWEAKIDDLATRCMIDGVEPATMASLRSLATDAENAGSPQSAALAHSLAASLESSTDEDSEGLFKDGFTQLRASMQRESDGTALLAETAYSSLGDDAELVADFLVEAREHLSQIEGQMLALERDPTAMEVIHTVFRAFHTIKGLAGFLGFSVVQAVAHEVETLLDLARNEKLTVDSSIVDVVLESGDFLLAEMSAIDRVLAGSASSSPADNRGLIAKIKRLAVPRQSRESVSDKTQESAPPTNKQISPAVHLEAEDNFFSPELPEASGAVPQLSSDWGASALFASTMVQTVASSPTTSAIENHDEPFDEAFGTSRLTGSAKTILVVSPSIDPVELPKFSEVASSVKAAKVFSTAHPTDPVTITGAVRMVAPAKTTEMQRVSEPSKVPDAGSVRVETAKLDHLMDMVGEMVIAQSLIRHSHVLLSANDSRLIGDLSHLARVTAEVQRATMSMRMVPVSQMFQKIERLIRDLSRKAGKQVVLETSGTETEVDKTVAEELSDPLLHMVRNSVDHGIEEAGEREAAGKDPTARIRLAAYHQGGQVVIAIADDGRGLNAEKIRKKAEQKNLVASTATLTEAEIYQLIFAPGFSTAETITDVSGRGVGMDVVRRNVEKLRGRIETQSTLGLGTTFLLKLPLTLAIIDGLVVEVGSNRYVIPLPVVREIFRPLESTLFSVVGRDEMVLVRKELMPIIRLNQRLGIQARATLPSEGLLVVIESESKRFCLLVDDLLGKQEVVIKSLGETFKDVSGISGCAVLGDGRIGLILDTDGIYRGRRR